ncbi:hypothetical protein H104_07781 [Trichophyton rubrum CBS 289.86]|nr:hypothetical protein H104_07781 [Trichophyton rubrum CBS 289.86]
MFIFNILVYLMANLRREAGAFFFFCLTTILTTLAQSAVFRALACLTRTPDQAMIPSAVLSLGLMIYTGFTTLLEYMSRWSRWMACINQLAYDFEALMQMSFTIGTFHVLVSYLVAKDMQALFFSDFVLAAEIARPPKTRGEVLLFHHRSVPTKLVKLLSRDAENHVLRHLVKDMKIEPLNKMNNIVGGGHISLARSLFDIKIKGETRRLLDRVDSWDKPGSTLEVIQLPPGSPKGKDWHQIWLKSPEYQMVHAELRHLR